MTTISDGPREARKRVAKRRAQERVAGRRTEALAARQGPTPNKVLLGLADLRALGISYSRQHLWRLVAKGKFPAPVALGPEVYARKAWRRADVEAWLAALPYSGGGNEAA